MKHSKFSEEQITYTLRQAESGTMVGDVCRQLGVSEATFYVWKKKYASLGVTELRELRQLREENSKLKRLVADLTLDKHILAEVIKKSAEARATAGAGGLDPDALSDQCAAGVSVSAVFTGSLLPGEHGARSIAAAHAYPRDRSSTTALRLSAHSYAVAARRLGDQQEACASPVSAGWPAAAHAPAATQAHAPAPGAGAAGPGRTRALEHGFCA